MGIEVAKTAGFCFGVNRAVQMVYDLIDAGESICTLGPIIHNPQLVEELAEKGVEAVASPREAAGRKVVIRSHGVAQSVYDEIAALGLSCVDATCPFVAKIHQIVAPGSWPGWAGDHRRRCGPSRGAGHLWPLQRGVCGGRKRCRTGGFYGKSPKFT